MTGARSKHTQRERQIARALDLSDAQLDALLAIRTGRWPGNAAAVLESKGYAYAERNAHGNHTGKSGLTEAGEALLRQAREMGF